MIGHTCSLKGRLVNGWALLALFLVLVIIGCGDDGEGAATASGEYDRWGGWRAVKGVATGRFRVEQIDGVWWLVTPAGHGFFSTGVDYVTPAGDFSPPLGTAPYHRNIIARHGSETAWAEQTLARLREWRFNTLGAWSPHELFAGGIAYAVTLRFSAHAPAVPGLPPGIVTDRPVRDYFDASFEAAAVAEAEGAAGCAADPWCIGVFTDNEIALGHGIAQPLPFMDAYLRLPAGAPGKRALQEFLARRYANDIDAFNESWGLALASFEQIQQLSNLAPAPSTPPIPPADPPLRLADRRTFDAHVAARFYQVAHDALRGLSPELLILGSRLLLYSARPEVVEAIAPFVDVLSVNYYELTPATLNVMRGLALEYAIPFGELFDDLDAMHEISGKPLLIGEFTYRAADSGLPNTFPPFFLTLATQAERARAAADYVGRVLDRPYMIGAHWFQYFDQPATGRFDGENQNLGLVTITDDPWPELTARFRTMNAEAARRHGGQL